MTKLPRITGAEMIRALKRGGFKVTHVRGSHHVLLHPDGRRTVVPAHAGETLATGTIKSILRSAGLNAEDLRDLL